METSAFLHTAIEKTMSYPLGPVISRYARDENLPYEVAETHVAELRKYLLLCGLNDNRRYGMRGQIDKAWHTFLLFTREYHEFCHQIAGRFIHHVPDGDDNSRSSSLENYASFLTDYEAFFGYPPPPELWPRPVRKSQSVDGCGGCDGCGVETSPNTSKLIPEVSEGCGHDGCNGCHGCSDK